MIVFTVHEPPDPPLDRSERAAELQFVRDRFSFAAALLGPLWMLSKRLWLGVGLYATAAVLIFLIAVIADLGPGWMALMLLAVHVIVGFEAASVRRWHLERRGWRMLGSVTGRNTDDCERRFFEGWLLDQQLTDAPPSAASGSRLAAMADGAIGDQLGRRAAGRWSSMPWTRRQP